VAWQNLAEDLAEEFEGLSSSFDFRSLLAEQQAGFQIIRRHDDQDKVWLSSWAKNDRRLNPGKYRANHRRYYARLKADAPRYQRRTSYQLAWLRRRRAAGEKESWAHIKRKLWVVFSGKNAGKHLARYAVVLRTAKTLLALHRVAGGPPGRRRLTEAQRAWVRATDFSPTKAAKILGVSKQAICAIRRV
jgi:hypothetical protein